PPPARPQNKPPRPDRGDRPGRRGRRRRPAEPAPAARPRPRPGPGLLHPIHPQDADLAAPGLDDPRLRPGLQPEGRGDLPRGLYDPHLDLAELPDPRLLGPGPSPGCPGGV